MVEEWIKGHEELFHRPEFLVNEWPDIDMHVDDQGILNEMLIANPEWQHALHYESQGLINSMGASFLRHHLRYRTPNLQERIKFIQQEVDRIL